MRGQVGNVYAEALFTLCRETDSLDAVHTELNACAAVLAANPELLQLLSVPTISTKEKLTMTERLFAGNEIVVSLLCLLVERNRIRYLQDVTEAFNADYQDAKNYAEMTVTTAVPLTETLRERLRAKLEEKSGKQVKLIEQVDASLLGGVMVRYGNTVQDNTVKTKLASLRQQLKQ